MFSPYSPIVGAMNQNPIGFLQSQGCKSNMEVHQEEYAPREDQ